MSEPCIRVDCPPFEDHQINVTYRFCSDHQLYGECPVCQALDPTSDYVPVPIILLPGA